MLAKEEQSQLLKTLEQRFKDNMKLHPEVIWDNVKSRLLKNPEKLNILNQMENTGGEPDVVSFETTTDSYIFIDCSKESPAHRRSLCYDEEALASRKKNKPSGSAEEKAKEIGVELLTQGEYKELQQLGEFDLKTSSWLQTPEYIRKLGGAIFGDRRFDTVFIYHNGAESYYAARGFRGKLVV